MAPSFESDVVDFIWDELERGEDVAEIQPVNTYKQQMSGEVNNNNPQKGGVIGYRVEDLPGIRRSNLIQPGMKIGICEVLGPLATKGRYGYFTNGMYALRCRCERTFQAKYTQIYHGSIYSCGCVTRPKHPPIRLENSEIGCLTVLRWAVDEAEGAWEAVCKECGAIVYEKMLKALRAKGASCDAHK